MKGVSKISELAFSLEMNGALDNNVYGFISSILYYSKRKNKQSKKFLAEFHQVINDFRDRGFFFSWFTCPVCKLEYRWNISQEKLSKIVERFDEPDCIYEELNNKEFYCCIDCDKTNGLEYLEKQGLEIDKKSVNESLDFEQILSKSIDFAFENIDYENKYWRGMHGSCWLQTIQSYKHYKDNSFIIYLKSLSENKKSINGIKVALENQDIYNNYKISISFHSDKLNKLDLIDKKSFYKNLIVSLNKFGLDFFTIGEHLD